METIIVCNVLLIVCAAALGFFFAPDESPRPVVALGAGWLATWLSLMVWTIFVAAHFITKLW